MKELHVNYKVRRIFKGLYDRIGKFYCYIFYRGLDIVQCILYFYSFTLEERKYTLRIIYFIFVILLNLLRTRHYKEG